MFMAFGGVRVLCRGAWSVTDFRPVTEAFLASLATLCPRAGAAEPGGGEGRRCGGQGGAGRGGRRVSGPGSVSDQVGSAGVATTVPRAGVRQFAGGQPPAAPPEALGTPPSPPPHASTPLPFSPAEFSLRLFVPESILPATLPLPLTGPPAGGGGESPCPGVCRSSPPRPGWRWRRWRLPQAVAGRPTCCSAGVATTGPAGRADEPPAPPPPASSPPSSLFYFYLLLPVSPGDVLCPSY